MPHDPVRVADTRAWLKKAALDLAAGAYELTADPAFGADAAFHAQQAAEKALKGFLLWHDVPLRKTHDPTALGGQCAALDPSIEPLARRAAALTQYSWKYRYPGEPEEPTRQEADAALALAREVYEAALARLPQAVKP